MDRPPWERVRAAALLLPALLLISFAFGSPQAKAKTSKIPNGAVKVKPWNVASVAKGVWCAKAPGRWKSYVPGKKTVIRRGKKRGTYFVTFVKMASTSRSTNEAERFKGTHRRYIKRCRQVRPLRFNFKKAIGLAVTTKKNKRPGRLRAKGATSTLKALLPSGNLRDAIESGRANVDNYWFGPDGRLFLEIIPGVDLTDATVVPKEGGCAFVEVQRATGIPSCVDWDIVNLMTAGDVDLRRYVQFDSEGNVYYAGWVQDTRKKNWDIKRVLRRKSVSGNITELVSWDKEVFEFVALPTGEVIARVADERTNGDPHREVSLQRISPDPRDDGETLVSGGIGGPVLFPDGNVYFSQRSLISPFDQLGVFRYLAAEGRLDSRPWFSTSRSEDAYLPYSSLCDVLGVGCPSVGLGMRTVTTSGGRVVSWGGDGRTLRTFAVQLFPEGAIFPAPTAGLPQAVAAGERILMIGAALSNRRNELLALLDLETGEQRVLLDQETSGLAPKYLALNRARDAAFMVAKKGEKQLLCRVDLTTYEVSILREVDNVSSFLRFDAFEFES